MSNQVLRQKSVCWSVTTCKPSLVWCHSAGSLSQRHTVPSIILLCSLIARNPAKMGLANPSSGHGR
ncbi:hypothetical protein JE959_004441 [Aeromonas veronii]|nr:hypothetical protein [Aeromonas veronii]